MEKEDETAGFDLDTFGLHGKDKQLGFDLDTFGLQGEDSTPCFNGVLLTLLQV